MSDIDDLMIFLITRSGFLKSIKAKLSNERFVENATKNVLENELKKEKDTLAKIAILKSKLIN